MLSTVTPLVAALSTGNKIGLAAVGGTFIVFALVSSFVLPRRNPNFPGRAVGWYSALGVLFFVAMISAVLVFGREKKESAPAATSTAASTTSATTPATTTTAGGGGGGAATGDAVAGKAIFTSAGCSGCHTLKAANATGNVGPNLDQLKPPFARVKRQVINGGGPMPAFGGTLSAKQINDVSAFVATAAGS